MANCNVNTHERFADIQMLRYELKGFDALSLNQKLYIYLSLIHIYRQPYAFQGQEAGASHHSPG